MHAHIVNDAFGDIHVIEYIGELVMTTELDTLIETLNQRGTKFTHKNTP